MTNHLSGRTIPGFGEYVRNTDPRLYGLIRWRLGRNCNVDDYQYDMLLGQNPWSINEEYPIKLLRSLGIEINFLKWSSSKWDGMYVTYSFDLPPAVPDWCGVMEQCRIYNGEIYFLSAVGPVQSVGDYNIPIMLCTVCGDLGTFRGYRGLRARKDVYVVGRMDVREIVVYENRRKLVGNRVLAFEILRREEGDAVETTQGRYKPTLRSAINTALKVDAAVPGWLNYHRERKEALDAIAEAQRLAEWAREPEDVGVTFFKA